jgi:S1-C subfamily serine protease
VKVVVEIVGGARAGQRLELDAARPIRLGRLPDNEVAFDPEADRDVSGRHCELRSESNQLWLIDVGSANGTRLNNVQVSRAPVPSPSEIELGAGGPRVRVSHDGAAAPIPATIARVTPPSSSATGKVGQRTVALMIQQALQRAQKEPERLRRLVVLLSALLVLTVGGVVVAYRLRPPAAQSLKREMVAVMEQQRAAGDAERATLQKRLDALSAQLARAGGTSGAAVARANHDAIYLVAVHSPTGDEQGFCSAFAISDDTVITNAHCVHAAEDLRKRGAQILLVQNGDGKKRLTVARMKRIRAFSPGAVTITPDVGWLKIDDGKLALKVTLATPAEYEALATGDAMFTYGFPGRLADVSAPEATFVSGVIGRATTLDGRSGEPKERRLIQHSAFTSSGTSGSPIFNAAGHVVAVNTGGYLDDGKVGKGALAGYNFGMRIDLAQELLSEGDE